MDDNKSKLIVFDCDPGIDDALALCLGISLFRDPIAVITSYGCSEIMNTTKNARHLLDLLGRQDIPVIRGSAKPLLWPHPIDGRILPTFFGDNGLNNVSLPASKITGEISTQHDDVFVEHVAGLLRSVDSIDYYLTGPCTNLAKICLRYPDLVKEKINRLHIMGGALGSGNSGAKDPYSGQGVSEFNFYLDPIAVDLVLSLNLKPRLITWDQAKLFQLSHSEVHSLHGKHESTQYLLKAIRNFFLLYAHDTVKESEKQSEPFVILSDPIVLMTNHESGHLVEKKVEIVMHGRDFGRSVESPDGHIVDYFEFVNPSSAMAYMLEGIDAEVC